MLQALSTTLSNGAEAEAVDVLASLITVAEEAVDFFRAHLVRPTTLPLSRPCLTTIPVAACRDSRNLS